MLTTNDKIKYSCDLIVANCAAYDAMCRANGTTRGLDCPDAAVVENWKQYCALTRERAKAIIDACSKHNFNRPTRQIQARYDVNGSNVSLTLNSIVYGRVDYVSAITALRHLGLRVEFI